LKKFGILLAITTSVSHLVTLVAYAINYLEK